MRVTFNPAIVSASGTLCKEKNGLRVIVTTRKAPSTNPCKTRMYIRSAASYQRSGKPSEKEIAARELFAKRQAFVQELLASGKYHSKAEAWKIAKKEIKS